ncbi:MAG: hypothetical protein U9R25_05355 [Chloroflexota bacterium]|nr:hypothetical protein [Chloroflexota bacterium]
MGGSGRIVGIVLMVIGLAVILIAGVLMIAQVGGEENTVSGAVLGMAIAILCIAAPLIGVGIYLFMKGTQEQTELAEVEKERELLNIVLARGEVTIADLVFELKSSRSEVKAMIHDLVGKGLFSGYINWEEGVLYSKQAGDMRETQKCPNCGGEQAYAGKGVIVCPYCGSELFLAT